MKKKLVVNYSQNKDMGENLNSLLDLCIKIDDVVDSICKSADIKKYEMFAGNHCIQTAACIKNILDDIFALQATNTRMMYGIMTDKEYTGKIYNHAYIVMEYGDNNYIIDTSRKTREALVCCASDETYAYGKSSELSIPEYDDIEILRLTEIDYDGIANEDKEYFTGKPSKELFNRVKFLCQAEIQGFKKW